MMMRLSQEQQAWFEGVRADWFTMMRPFESGQGEDLFSRYPAVHQSLLQECRVYSDRNTAIAAHVFGGIGAEVGTKTGGFARYLLDNCVPDRLHLFDLEDRDIRENNPAILTDPRVELHLGDSSSELSRFGDQHFDWIYIDADHSYLGVKKDLAEAVRAVKPGKLVILNDYVAWSALELMPYGVVQAVNEFLFEHHWEVVYFAFGWLMYCDIAIRRPN